MAMVGEQIGKFTLVRQLGAGGMGATWEAVRRAGHDFEQRVAIKLADQELLHTSEGLTAFRREAVLAASLRHPNIAAVLDVDERAGSIVCELVDGADLRAVLRAAPSGRLDTDIAVHVMSQIARGLSHAHRRILRGRPSPIIHRDMSPGNIVIDYDGNVKIVDFGIAQVISGANEPLESVKGKLSYMAPEQAMGGRLDWRVDQYALGVIAYEMLSGVRPNDGSHEGETLACLLGGLHVPLAKRIEAVPRGLTQVVDRMLALRPEQRFASLEDVLDALAPFTPSLTTYRALVPLVVAARQPHTILCENGRFVSQPVEIDPFLLPTGSTPGDSPADVALAAALQGQAALAATLGGLPRTTEPHEAPANRLQQAAPQRAPARRAAEPHRPRVLHKPSLSQRVLSSPRLWQGLTLLGIALLGLVLWVAISPDALLFFAPKLAPSGATGSAVREPVQWLARAADRASPALLAAAQRRSDTTDGVAEPRAALGAANAVPPAVAESGTLEIEPVAPPEVPARTNPAPGDHPRAVLSLRVSPWGRVWVDDEYRGVAAPALQLSLAPGRHVIAVGHKNPVERRTLDLHARAAEHLEFEVAQD